MYHRKSFELVDISPRNYLHYLHNKLYDTAESSEFCIKNDDYGFMD